MFGIRGRVVEVDIIVDLFIRFCLLLGSFGWIDFGLRMRMMVTVRVTVFMKTCCRGEGASEVE